MSQRHYYRSVFADNFRLVQRQCGGNKKNKLEDHRRLRRQLRGEFLGGKYMAGSEGKIDKQKLYNANSFDEVY